MDREYSLLELLRRPDVSYEALRPWMGELAPPASEVTRQVEVAAKYAGYIERQRGEVERQASQEKQRIPDDMDYTAVRGLSTEARQKLSQQRPETVGQAARIQGMTPAAISLLLVDLKRRALAGASREKSA